MGSFEPQRRASFDAVRSLEVADDLVGPSSPPPPVANLRALRDKVEHLRLPAWWLPSASWRLVWCDDFDYVGLPDPRRWSFQVSCNRWVHDEHHNELQWYTSGRKENAWVEGGLLRVTAVREKWGALDYTSARLHTKGRGDWRFGRVEVCAKLPPFRRGIWPGVWLMPSESKYGRWPASGEIDLCETVGWQSGLVHASVHTAAFNHRNRSHSHASFAIDDVDQAFHVYSIDWRPDKITIRLDGEECHAFDRVRNATWREWPFDQHFFLLLNVAVGGNWAGKHGVDPTAFPASLEVAYVRVFKEI